MTADVHHLRIATVGDGPTRSCNAILKAAKGKLQDVIVIGWDRAGDFYTNRSMDDGPTALWLIEQARKELLDQ